MIVIYGFQELFPYMLRLSNIVFVYKYQSSCLLLQHMRIQLTVNTVSELKMIYIIIRTCVDACYISAIYCRLTSSIQWFNHAHVPYACGWIAHFQASAVGIANKQIERCKPQIYKRTMWQIIHQKTPQAHIVAPLNNVTVTLILISRYVELHAQKRLPYPRETVRLRLIMKMFLIYQPWLLLTDAVIWCAFPYNTESIEKSPGKTSALNSVFKVKLTMCDPIYKMLPKFQHQIQSFLVCGDNCCLINRIIKVLPHSKQEYSSRQQQGYQTARAIHILSTTKK